MAFRATTPAATTFSTLSCQAWTAASTKYGSRGTNKANQATGLVPVTLLSRRSLAVVSLGPLAFAALLALADSPFSAEADPATPICETANADSFSPTLQWSTGRVYVQQPTYQYQVQSVPPVGNDGPGAPRHDSGMVRM